MYGRGFPLAREKGTEPFMSQEKITNEDGTPSDYFIRYLRNAITQGDKNIKFPVTSVNGMTGDVIIDIKDLINAEFDYSLINEKLQELIYLITELRQYVIQRFIDHINDYHKYAFQGFMSKTFGDDRMFMGKNRAMVRISAVSKTGATQCNITTVNSHGLIAGDTFKIEDIAAYNSTSLLNGEFTVLASPAPTATTFSFTCDTLASAPTLNPYARVIIDDDVKSGMPMYIPSITSDAPVLPGSTAFFANPVGSGAAYARKRIRTFGIMVVEKTMAVKRIYIPIRGANIASALDIPTATEYSKHQFAIFKAGTVDCVSEYAALSGLPSDTRIRFPDQLVWCSSVLDTRGLNSYVTTTWAGEDVEPWPNTRLLLDAEKYGVTTYTIPTSGLARTSGSDGYYPLSFDVDFTIKRGVYYLGLQTWKVGGRAIYYMGDTITPYMGSTSSSPQALLPCYMNQYIYSSTNFGTNDLRDSFFSIATPSSYPALYNFNLLDMAQAAIGTEYPDFSTTPLSAYLRSENIIPGFSSAGASTTVFYTETGSDYVGTGGTVFANDRVDVSFNPLSEKTFPVVGFSGTFADVQPQDTW